MAEDALIMSTKGQKLVAVVDDPRRRKARRQLHPGQVVGDQGRHQAVDGRTKVSAWLLGAQQTGQNETGPQLANQIAFAHSSARNRPPVHVVPYGPVEEILGIMQYIIHLIFVL